MQCIGGYPTKPVTVYRLDVKTFALLKFYSFLANTHFKTFSAYGPKAIKLIKQIGKKYRKLPRKNCPLFIAYKVFQWQYK